MKISSGSDGLVSGQSYRMHVAWLYLRMFPPLPRAMSSVPDVFMLSNHADAAGGFNLAQSVRQSTMLAFLDSDAGTSISLPLFELVKPTLSLSTRQSLHSDHKSLL